MAVLSTPWPEMLGLVWFDFPSQSFSGDSCFCHRFSSRTLDSDVVPEARAWLQCQEQQLWGEDAQLLQQQGDLGAHPSLGLAGCARHRILTKLQCPQCLRVFCVRRSCLSPAGNLTLCVQGLDFALSPLCHIIQALQVLLLFF